MGVSAAQKKHIVAVCACGCGKEFNPFPVYLNAKVRRNINDYIAVPGDRGATLCVPKYIRGHHPNCHKHPAWNKGLTKDICPTLSKMGFQPGHKPYNDWSKVVEKQRTDPEYRRRWLAAKKGQTPWNKGKTKSQYANGIKSGAEHGNWCGGHNGLRDTADYKRLCNEIRKRDNWTCQECGDRNHEGRGSRIILEVHHIIAYSENPQLADNPNNLITLCKACHRKTENYGTKLIHKRKKKGGN